MIVRRNGGYQMEKVICDVCGIAYPETAAQCPICGCARSGNGQTSACDTVQVEDDAAYNATKGGRFSKNNVRKRLKAQQIQPVPLEMPPRAPKKEEPVVEEYEDNEEYDEDDDDEMPASNRGLVIVVVLLLLAIIAVSCYIAIVHFDIFGSKAPDKSGRADEQLSTTAPADPTDSTEPTKPSVQNPCTGLELADSELTLGGNVLSMQISYSVEPIDTDDIVKFTSSNSAVATVDKNGNVTAVGNGEATITITCGKISKTCKVTCVMGEDKPDVPDVPVEPEKNYYLRVNNAKPNYPRGEYGCEASFKTGAVFTLKIVDDEGAAMDVTWTASKDEMVVIDGNKIKCYKPGNVTITATYNGTKYSCYAIISGTPIDLPTEDPETPENPENPENPDEPAEPTETYLIKINSAKPNYLYNNQPNSAEVTLPATQKFKLTLVEEELEQIMSDVEWKLSDDTVCSFDGTYVTGLKKGTCKITAEYKGVTYLVFVRVSAAPNP
jgi:hypothetical protein